MINTLLSPAWKWLTAGSEHAYDQSSTQLYGWSSQLADMRTRDIRRIAEKLGAAKDDLERILDKHELRTFTHSLIQEEISHRSSEVLNERVWRYTLIALGVGLIIMSRKPILALTRGFIEYLRSVEYQVMSKYGLIKLSVRHRLPLVCASLVLAAALELVAPLMQMSIVLSWVLPSHSHLRRYLFPSLSIPISADMLVKTVTGANGGSFGESSSSSSGRRSSSGGSSSGGSSGSRSSKGSSGGSSSGIGSSTSSSSGIGSSISGALGNLGSYGLNVGPMLTVMVCTYVKGRLENWAASYLLDIVKMRRCRHESRKEKQRDRFDQQRDRFDIQRESKGNGGGVGGGRGEGRGVHAGGGEWYSDALDPSRAPPAENFPGSPPGRTTGSAFGMGHSSPHAHAFFPQSSRGSLDIDEILRHSNDDVFGAHSEDEAEGGGQKDRPTGSTDWDAVD